MQVRNIHVRKLEYTGTCQNIWEDAAQLLVKMTAMTEQKILVCAFNHKSVILQSAELIPDPLVLVCSVARCIFLR